MKQTLSTAGRIVADICLYGTRQTGAGWLAATSDASIRLGSSEPVMLYGNGEPNADRSFTEAVFQAVDALQQQASLKTGLVRIFAPGGQQMATVDLGGAIPYYGSLPWVAI